MPRAHAELHAELDALAFASAEALDRLRDDDESGVHALIAQRERVLTLLASAPVTDEALGDAARRALALDPELMMALRTRLTAVGHEIDQLMRTRRSLASYGATPAGSVFVERLS